jgi:hypothetical protein
VAQLGQAAATPAHRHPPGRQQRLDPGEPGLQPPEAALLLEPLGSAGIAAHLPMPTADRHGQARPQPPDRTA